MASFVRITSSVARAVASILDERDDEELRTRKATLALFALTSSVLAFVWIVTFFLLGRPLSASIPIVYQVLSIIGLIGLARTNNFGAFRLHQLVLILTLPFVLQWSLGGFVQGSAVAIWALATPALALLLGARPAPWFLAFLAMTVLSVGIDAGLREAVESPSETTISVFFALNFFGAGTSFFVGLTYFNRERERARSELAAEQAKSEALLLNVLPAPIARRLKDGEELIADAHQAVTVMFIDIVGFTSSTADMAPTSVAASLDEIFSALDDLTDRFGLEKIKTIGDGYQVVGGAPVDRPDHAAAVAEMALAVQHEIAGRPFAGGVLQLRYGIDSGPVVAAVIGKRKFSYDMWGDVVNTASRMESHGVPGRIQVTDRLFEMLGNDYAFSERGDVEIKGKGVMRTYFLDGRRDSSTLTGASRPNPLSGATG